MRTQRACNPSEQPGPFLPPLSDNGLIWGRNADEVSHWGGWDTTCSHGTDAQLPFFYPTCSLLSLFFSNPSPIIDLRKPPTFSRISLCLSFFQHLCLSPCPSASYFILLSASPSSLSLFTSSSFRPDIWANNQCHFIPVREQMEFQLRAWQQAANKGFSVKPLPSLCSRDPSLHQVPITSSSHKHLHGPIVHGGTPWHLQKVERYMLVTWRRMDVVDRGCAVQISLHMVKYSISNSLGYYFVDGK